MSRVAQKASRAMARLIANGELMRVASSQNASRAAWQSGFTYLGLLFLIAIMSAVLASTGTVWHTMQMREKERELLFVGNQIRHAIQLYYDKTPGTVKQYPKSLEDLLKDKRYLTTQRYLRKIYLDPITVKPEWGVVEAPDGGISGIYSLSEALPIKTKNFSEADQAFEGQTKYSDWKFAYVPKQLLVPPATAVQPQ